MSDNMSTEEFSATEAYRTISVQVDSNTVLILVNSAIRGGIQASLDQYISDLEQIEQYAVIVHEVTGGLPVDLKAHIASQYDLLFYSNPLAGCVLIGKLPVPWCGYTEKYPIDLYYMDLLNEWNDPDEDGVFDQIPGHPEPVIWIGRLTPDPLPGNEIDLLNNYFTRNHNYRVGDVQVLDRAMAYVDDDWTQKGDYGLSSAYSDVTVVNDKAATDADDYKVALGQEYEFVHVAVHSRATEHNFKANSTWDGSVSFLDILTVNPQSVFYILDACKAARYTEDNYIGGCYIFSGGGRGLVVIGETQNANSMDGPGEFYSFFGTGLSLGESFLKWIKMGGRAGYHKDRTILGDPTLKKRTYYSSPGSRVPTPPTGFSVT